MAGDVLLRGGMNNFNTQKENSLNNIPPGEVLYGSGRASRFLDPLVRRNRH